MTKEEAITELNTFKIGAKSECGENALDMAIKALEQQKKGKWLSKGDPYPAWKYCSECKEPWSFDCGTPNFCPVCGAKMESESKK